MTRKKTFLDLSKADGSVRVSKEIIDRVSIRPESLASMPSRDLYIELKESLSKFYSFPPGGIVIGNGSDELIESIAGIVSVKKSVTLVPCFERLYEVGRKFDYENYTFSLSKDDDYKYTDSSHEKLLSRINNISPGIIWLCSPNNPTGEIIPPDQIHEISRIAKDALVVVDAAFADFTSDILMRDYGALASSTKNIVILGSFSKSWGLAALRVGFALTSPEVANKISNRNVMFNVNGFGAEIAIQCLLNDRYRQGYIHATRQGVGAARSKIIRMPNIEMVSNSDINLFCVRLRSHDNLHEKLLDCGIKTKLLDNMLGMENMGFCRITVPGVEKDMSFLLISLASQ